MQRYVVVASVWTYRGMFSHPSSFTMNYCTLAGVLDLKQNKGVELTFNQCIKTLKNIKTLRIKCEQKHVE